MSFADKMRLTLSKPSVAGVATAAVATPTLNAGVAPVAEIATVAVAEGQTPDDIRQIIRAIAPRVNDELAYLIWTDAFNPRIEGTEAERVAHVQYWAELAKDRPETVYLAISTPPAYLKYLEKRP